MEKFDKKFLKKNKDKKIEFISSNESGIYKSEDEQKWNERPPLDKIARGVKGKEYKKALEKRYGSPGSLSDEEMRAAQKKMRDILGEKD